MRQRDQSCSFWQAALLRWPGCALAIALGMLTGMPWAAAQDVTEGEHAVLPAPLEKPADAVSDPFGAARKRAQSLQKTNAVEWPSVLSPSGAPQPASGLRPAAAQTLQSEDGADRLRAAEACALLEPAAVLDLLFPLLNDPDESVRWVAAELLRKTDADALAERILAAMNDEKPAGLWLDVLPVLAPEVQTKALSVLRTENEPSVRRQAAARALGFLGAPDALEALSAQAWSEDPALAMASAEGLDELNAPGALAHWIKLLTHPEFAIAKRAVEALARQGGRAAFAALQGIVLAAAPPSERLRARAAQALAEWPPEDAGPVLVQLMENYPAFQDVAHQLLRETTGQDFGPQPQGWRNWFEQGMPSGTQTSPEAASPLPPEPSAP